MIGDDKKAELMAELDAKIERYAQAKGDSVYLDQYRKSLKAMLMKKHAAHHPTTAAQEREAYADPEYQAHITAMQEAEYAREKAYWELKKEEWKFDAWRTRAANARAERGRYGA